MSALGLAFDDPWVLWLLPLTLLPLFVASGTPLSNGWLRFAPRDRASEAIGWLLRGATTLALGALVFALAGPHRRRRGSPHRCSRSGSAGASRTSHRRSCARAE